MSDSRTTAEPSLLVLSSLFPSEAQPQAGVFIRERMFRVAREVPVVVVSPQPWFPLLWLIRLFRPGYRMPVPEHSQQAGVDVFYPRFLAVPGVLRRFDGWLMARGAAATVRRLVEERGINLIDAHFAYPDGYAAAVLSRRFGLPYTVTLRGTEVRMSRLPALRKRLVTALNGAAQVITVANSLRDTVLKAGAEGSKITRVGNGVDTQRFRVLDRQQARAELGIKPEADVMISVGGLVPRKGFHRIIELLPELLHRNPRLHYIIVGGASPEGDFAEQLREQAMRGGVAESVSFLGPVEPEKLAVPLSAADVFVLATENEGWANVFLEAMACGLPVITTTVGGNAEVVCNESLGTLVPFGDAAAMADAIEDAIQRSWDRAAIRRHAEANDWSSRIDSLVAIFRRAVADVP